MAGHAQWKFVMKECSKTQIRLTRSSLRLSCYHCGLPTLYEYMSHVTRKWLYICRVNDPSKWHVSNGAMSLALCQKFPLVPYSMCMSSKGFGETAQLSRFGLPVISTFFLWASSFIRLDFICRANNKVPAQNPEQPISQKDSRGVTLSLSVEKAD